MRRLPLRLLIQRRRTWAADALRCEERADAARPEGIREVARWRTLAEKYWKLACRAHGEYQRIVTGMKRPTGDGPDAA